MTRFAFHLPSRPGTLRPAVLLLVLAGTAIPGVAPAAASGRILQFSLDPASPTTGDPVRFRAEIEISSCCAEPVVSIGFGPQPELSGLEGWALEIEAEPGPLPQITIIPIDERLGPLPLAGGEGVLRLRLSGETVDTMFFDLDVRAGPAAGWAQLAGHGGFTIPATISALASLPDQLAIAAPAARTVAFVDPAEGRILSTFIAPGSGDVRGMATDLNVLFLSIQDFSGPRIYRVDRLGRVLGSFASPTVSPGNRPLEGLALLDGVLYGSHPAPSILFAMNPITGARLWQRSLAAPLAGLAPAGRGLLGVEASGSFYFVEASADGTDRILADPADHGLGFVQMTGLAYDGFGAVAWDAVRLRGTSVRTFALWWAVDGTLRAYLPGGARTLDVLRGRVAELLQLAGNVDLAGEACLVNDGAGGVVPSAGVPPEGEAFYYVSRFVSADGFEQSYGRSSSGFRRIDRNASCP